jgi:hypothetical protein
LDVIGGETAIVQRFKEELDGLEEVGVGVNNGVLNGVAVQ